jgi:membrane-associated phospholipid phosphatase
MIAEPRGGRIPAWIGLALIALGVAAVPFDLTVFQWFKDKTVRDALNEILVVCEAFGNGAGLPCFVCLIWLLAPRDRPRLPRLVTAALAAGLAADAIKMLVCRMRPVCFNLQQPSGAVSDTFHGCFMFGAGGSSMQSFPSAHAALACGMALALTRLYPAGRPLFLVMGVAVCLQRVVVGMHYLSDVLCGAALGWFVGYACCYGTILARGFDALERRWAGGRVAAPCPPGTPALDRSTAAERSLGRESTPPHSGFIPSEQRARIV